jgi:hypothetical protein
MSAWDAWMRWHLQVKVIWGKGFAQQKQIAK